MGLSAILTTSAHQSKNVNIVQYTQKHCKKRQSDV